jgi:apolipoprotein N-acyltransferase
MLEARPDAAEPGRRLTVGWRPQLLGFALGLLHAACFAPWGAWWSQLFVLGGFAALTRASIRHGRPPARVALAGLWFGFGWFVAGVGWLFVSMHTYGQMPAALALLALVLFALYLGLFPAAAVWATARLGPQPTGSGHGDLRFALAFAGSLTLAELGRGFLFTGFPWLAVGYAHVDGPLAGYAPLAGSYGVGFAACFVAALLAVLFSPHPAPAARARPAAVLVAVAALGAGLQAITWGEPVGGPLKIRLLQGNVPQQMKFEPTVARQTMQRYLELVEAEPADLIVLPETAWTVPWASTPPQLRQRLETFVTSSGSAVAIGLPLAAQSSAGDPTLSNSVLLFDPSVFRAGQPPARYDKRHLVPFGEFVPWGFRWFVDLMTIPLGDFARGDREQRPFDVGGQRIAFNICYEDVFGEELLPALRGDHGATILANVSNIAWFGDSHALPQHLQIARMRTLETARPMIRATNTGVTAAIDFDGAVIAALPTYQLGALSVTVQGRSGLTPYARGGNWPILVLALAALAAAAGGRRKPAKIAALR